MNTFVGRVSRELELSQATVHSALCNILHFIAQEADAELADQFISRLPGARELLEASQAPDIAFRDTDQRSRAASGSAGPRQVSRVIACLSKSGLDIGEARRFLALFVDFARAHAGVRLVRRLLEDQTGLDVLVRSGQHQRGSNPGTQPDRPSERSEAQTRSRLEAAGIRTLGQLLHACTTPEGRSFVAEATAIGPARLLHMLEFTRSDHGCGFATDVIRVLETANIHVVKASRES